MIFIVHHLLVNDIHYLLFHSFLSPTENINVIHSLNDIQCPWFFPKNGSEITKNFYYIFRYILMSLCYVESLSRFRAQIFELWQFLKMSHFLKISLYYSPWFFPKNGSEITKIFYYIF